MNFQEFTRGMLVYVDAARLGEIWNPRIERQLRELNWIDRYSNPLDTKKNNIWTAWSNAAPEIRHGILKN